MLIFTRKLNIFNEDDVDKNKTQWQNITCWSIPRKSLHFLVNDDDLSPNSITSQEFHA